MKSVGNSYLRITQPLLAAAGLVVGLSLSNGCSSSSSNDGAGGTTYTSGDASAGQTAVTKRACMTCHGSDLSGSTSPYATSSAYPANLTPDTETGLGGWDAATIKAAILQGVDDEGNTLCTTMPRFGGLGMTDQEATDIVAYLKTLSPVMKKIPQSECASSTAGAGG